MFSLVKFFRGFVYAGKGIMTAVREERNVRFHLCAAVSVYLFSLFYDFDAVRYAILTLTVALVIALELANTAIERAVAKPDAAHDAFAGAAKDVAAGAVLVAAIGAVLVGVCLFADAAALRRVAGFFVRPWPLVGLVAYLGGCTVFVFRRT